jgi:retinol dehydrogenase 14
MAWDVSGKTVLVTGATSGIGLEASVDLARRTEAAVAAAKARSGSKHVSLFLCDFSSLAQIRGLAEAVRARHDHLHVLVNNAGGVNEKRRVTGDGIEATFAVNHLGYFLLTNLLLELLVRSAPARVVSVASVGHRQGTLDFDDLGFERGYSIMRAYSRSKLANVLFSAELARRLAGTGVTSNSVHPGSVDTNIWSGAPWWAKPIISLLLRPFFVSAAKGAAAVVRLAALPDLADVTGEYFEEDRRVLPAPLARDEALARRLWETSAALVGLPASGPLPAVTASRMS